MPVAPAGNAYLLGVDIQTNESTVSSTADYSMAVLTSNSLGPVEDRRRVEVTDSSSIIGDPYKGPQSWAGSFTMPAYAASFGTLLHALYPTNSTTGAGPYTHAPTGLGGTQQWISLYSEWPNAGTFEQTFGKGLLTELSVAASAEGGPITIGASAVGQEASVANWTASAADDLDDGYFSLQTSGSKIEIDVDTPNVNPSTQPEDISNFSLAIRRGVTPEPVVDSFTVTNLGQGKVEFDLSMDWLWSSWDAYRASYFGAVAGSTASSTIVAGALELTANHTVQTGGTWQLRIYIPKVEFFVSPPDPDAGGAPLRLSVTGNIMKPSSGDHVQFTLINGVTTYP